MIYINTNGKEPDQNWRTKADAITQQLLKAKSQVQRNKIIDGHKGIWEEIKQHLLDISNQKCWYSESKENYSHWHVDHFRPKKKAIGINRIDYGGYWWLAFQWTNYRVCGNVGNVRKKDYFAVKRSKANSNLDPIEDEIYYLLDPTNIEDTLKLTFDEEGKAKPTTTNIQDWDYERAVYTIERLNLNFKALKDARKSKWKECYDLIQEIKNLLGLEQRSQSAARHQQISDKLLELKDLAKEESEFSATAKTCLLCSGLIWAQRIAA